MVYNNIYAFLEFGFMLNKHLSIGIITYGEHCGVHKMKRSQEEESNGSGFVKQKEDSPKHVNS